MGVIARQTIKGSIANYLGIAIGFVITFFVLTDCLSPSEIGLTRILVDAAMIFSSLAMLGTNNSIIRFFPYFRNDSHNAHGFFAWALLVPLIGYTIYALLFIIFKNGIISLYQPRSPLLAQYIFYLLPLTFFALYMTIFESCANVLMSIAVPKFVREVLVRLFNLVAYLLYGNRLISIDTFVFLFCTSYAIAAIVDFIYLLLLHKISFRIDRHFVTPTLLRQIASYTLLITIVALASNVQLFNSLFIGAQGGLAMAGVYTIASYIANVIGVPSRSLLAISGPVMAQHMKDGNTAAANELAQRVSLHQLLMSIMLYFFICINLDALYATIPNGATYAGGTIVVLIMGLSNILSQTASIVIPVLSYSHRYALSLPFSILLTATALILNALLIPLLGISGAAVATLGSTVVYYSAQLIYVRHRLHISIFSRAQLRVLAVALTLVILYLLWTALITPLISNILLDAIAKSITLAAIALWMTWRIGVSHEVNTIITSSLQRLHLLH